MKKIITLITVTLLSSILASAQYMTTRPHETGNEPPLTPVCVQFVNGRILEFENDGARDQYNMQCYEAIQLLKRENKLLTHRSTATILSLTAGAVSTVGTLFRDENNVLTPFGQGVVLTGSVVTLCSAIWLTVNEFQLISTRKKINKHMQISVFPNGLKMEF